MTPPLPPRFYSLAEAAAVYHVSTRTMHRWLRTGQVRGKKIGGLWRFPVEAVDADVQHDRRHSSQDGGAR